MKTVVIALSCVFACITTGCDKYTRYNVLTFFFTGVPHPDEPQDEAARKKKGAFAAGAKKERKTGAREISSLAYTHGPFGAGQCNLCHLTAPKESIRTSDKKDDKKAVARAIPTWEGGLPGRLTSPLKELCIECHATKSARSAFSKDLWIHGPVSDGLCTACHSPHQSPFPYMLLMEKSRDLCGKCHAKGFILAIEEHKQDKECISCHNPHLGKNRFLLKEDLDEVY